MILGDQEDALEPLLGRPDPVLSFNLSAAHDFNPGMQFLDLMKSSRPWFGRKPGEWGGMKHEELVEGGYLDEAGWVKAIPPGITSVATAFSWGSDPQMAAYRQGRYVITWSGAGKLETGGDARVVWRADQKIVIRNSKGGNWWLDITWTDPDKTGDYIRDIRIVPERYLPLYEAGAVFNPDWLVLIAEARDLRFMDWLNTNDSEVRHWSDRALPDGPLGLKGHAIEDMVRLANEVGANPWFTMPHLADDDYIRRFALYVRDHLDPRLIVRVEWSNEVWNSRFAQTRWVRKEAKARWGQDGEADFAVMQAVRTARIWREVFAETPDRLRTVLGSWANQPRYSARMLSADLWRQQEPDSFVPPATVFDELAVASYFGDSRTSDPVERDSFLRALDQGRNMNRFLHQRTTDSAHYKSLQVLNDALFVQKQIAREYGLRLVGYEGGQHVHAFISTRIGDGKTERDDINRMHDALIDYVRSAEMAGLYSDLWTVWTEIGDGAFMQYTDVSRSGQYGSWGLYRGLGDNPPRARTLRRLAAGTEPWWGPASGPQYQQGVIGFGHSGNDRLKGTAEEDYLLAGPGDDTLIASPGRDGLNGGEGRDEAIYPEPQSAYTLRAVPGGVRVTGAGTDDFLTGVETLIFAGGVRVDVETISP